MRIEGKHVTVKNEDGDVVLRDLSFSFETGQLAILATDDVERAVTFAMAASGRLRKYKGVIGIVEQNGPRQEDILGLREIRALTAVPFVPVIGEPDPYLKAWRVLKEEFLFARERMSRRQVIEYLSQVIDQTPHAEVPGGSEGQGRALASAKSVGSLRMKDLDPLVRIRIFTELAARRPGVRFVFVTLPERFGGLPEAWFGSIEAIRTERNAVILTTTRVVAELIGRPYYDIDHGMVRVSHQAEQDDQGVQADQVRQADVALGEGAAP
jgi:hypothetical protein